MTGVIGAGKSSVITILHQLGIPVIDCDRLNEDLQQPGQEGYMQIINAFGPMVLHKDNTIDKEVLSSIIFHNIEKKQVLESIMHPLIQQAIVQKIKQLSTPMVVVEVPLLYEIHWEACFDETWVVACDQDILLERLSSQRKISRKEAQLRLSHQMAQEDKILKANYVLYNDRDRAYLKQQILTLLEKG